jgi:5,10-methylene-tetrahydrofolate dehydrogenase/methenyl tetrahydrofolate cyclohydrolase
MIKGDWVKGAVVIDVGINRETLMARQIDWRRRLFSSLRPSQHITLYQAVLVR